ncbi:MAG: NAD(P)H-dependent oxidoreductase subunit E [Planctomycetota bacterium]|nr:NAD(P)H-dependent oxidoreductase subunit E [Planctomycetota bacterium]
MSTTNVQTTGAPPVPVSFPPKEIKQQCDAIVARYPTRMAACLPVLHVAQKHYGGWISPEVEAGVAEYLEVGDSHIRGLLTFYAMFNTKPSGRHEVWVCRTLTCWLRGAAKLRSTALAKAGVDGCGVESADGRFLVKDMECLGLCEVAPAVFVDGEPHVHVTPEKLEELMDGCE